MFTLDLTEDDRTYYEQQQAKVRQLQLLRFIQHAQKGGPQRLELHANIEHIISIMHLSIKAKVNHAEVVTMTLVMGFWAVRWGYTNDWRLFMQYAYAPLIAHKDPIQMTQYYRIYSLLQQREGNLQASLENARQAYEYSLQSNNIFARKTALSRYSHVCLQLDENLEQLDQIQQDFWNDLLSVHIHPDHIPREVSIPTVSNMIEISRKQKDIERARYLINLFSLDPDDPDVDDHNKANWFHNTGLIATWMLGDYVGASRDLFQASRLFLRADDKHGEASALCDLGMNYIEAGDLNHANWYIRQSYEIAREYCAPHTRTTIIGNLGLLLVLQGYHDDAEPYLQTHLKGANNLGLETEYARGLSNCAMMDVARGNYARAFEQNLQALFIRKKTQDEGYAKTVSLQSYLAYLMGDFDQLHYYIRMLDDWQAHHHISHQRIQIHRLRFYGLLAQQRLIPDAIEPKRYYYQAINMSDSPLIQAILHLDLCRFAPTEERSRLWQQAEDLFAHAGARGWVGVGSPDAPPHILLY